jgi:hypothetical protein
LQEGKFFRLETDSRPTSFSFNGRLSKTEYFWLCGLCSKSMTLRLSSDGTVVTEALPESAQHNSEDFAIISRHCGRLLRSVTFVRSRAQEIALGRSRWNSQS